MRRFFIHINQPDELILDPEGMEFPDLEAAKNAARTSILELAMESLKGGEAFETVSLQICNERGEALAEVYSQDVLRELQVKGEE